MLKVVLIDIDGVLADSLAANVAFERSVLVAAGYKSPTVAHVRESFHMALRDAIGYLTHVKSQAEIDRIFKLSHTLPYPHRLLVIPPDVVKVVRQLAKQYRLGIVTSRIHLGVEAFFKACPKLRRYFKVVVGFENYQHPKPHPEPMLKAVRAFKVKPNEAVYIGDGLPDVLSAHAAGMQVIIYGNSRKKVPGADAYVRSWARIPAAVARLSLE